jgi:PAS domain S-box-containing protein
VTGTAPLLAPLAVVSGAARALTGHEPTADRIQALCEYLRAALPASAVRFHGRVRRSDFAAAGVIADGATTWQASVLRSDGRTATLEVAESPRASAEVQELLDGVAALLAAVLSASASEESDDDGALARIHRLTIDSLPVGLYVVDRELRVVLWNRKRETGTQGLRRSDVLGRRVTEVLRRQSASALEAAFAQVFATGISQEHEQEVRVGDEVRTYRTSRLPMHVDGVTVSHVVTIGEDVTETRAIQRAMHQAEKLAAVGQLAAGVMHEINNPLATIGGCAGAIAARLGTDAAPQVAEYLGMIESEVGRCTGIIEGLLDFARAGRAGIAFVPTDLNAVVLRTLELLQHHQRFRRLHVTQELVTPLSTVAGHEERLVQAAMAILLNAADAMAGAGNLTVRTLAQGERVVLEIEDDGPGIPADVLPRIFDPFFTTKAQGRGTGLGLAICYGIVADHHGELTVRSEPGRGSTFRMSLPIRGKEES